MNDKTLFLCYACSYPSGVKNIFQTTRLFLRNTKNLTNLAQFGFEHHIVPHVNLFLSTLQEC